MSKKVSIIIPNFNKAAFLESTIDSILSQKYENWEAVFVDDGSTDNSVELINSAAQKDARIKLFKRDSEPKGGASCRNIGIEKSSGDYILFLDSDDVLLPDCLRSRVEFIINKSVDYCVYNVGTFYHEVGDSTYLWKVEKGDHLEGILMHTIPWNIMSVLWKKEAIESLGGFNTHYKRYQDIEFHTRALLKGLKYSIKDNKPDSLYRISEERASLDKTEITGYKWESAIRYINEFSEELRSSGKEEKIYLLKGTLLEAKRSVLWEYVSGNIAKLSESEIPLNFPLSTLERIIFSLYEGLYKIGFYRLRGFNYIFKKVFLKL